MVYDFIDKLNLSNGLILQKPKAASYTAYVGRGNNAELIKDIIKKRWWWRVAESGIADADFVWTQKSKFHKIPVILSLNKSSGKVNRIVGMSSSDYSYIYRTQIEKTNISHAIDESGALLVQAWTQNINQYWADLCKGTRNQQFKHHTKRILEQPEGKQFIEKLCKLLQPCIVELSIITNIEENRLIQNGVYESEEPIFLETELDQPEGLEQTTVVKVITIQPI